MALKSWLIDESHLPVLVGRSFAGEATIKFSNGRSVNIRESYLTPIWRLEAARGAVLDVDSIALEFPVAIDGPVKSTRMVQAIAQAIPPEHADRYLSVYQKHWAEQNDMRPQDIRARLIYSSPRAFAADRGGAEPLRVKGGPYEHVESITDHFAVYGAHALFVELSYSKRLAPDAVDRSLEAVLRGGTLSE